MSSTPLGAPWSWHEAHIQHLPCQLNPLHYAAKYNRVDVLKYAVELAVSTPDKVELLTARGSC